MVTRLTTDTSRHHRHGARDVPARSTFSRSAATERLDDCFATSRTGALMTELLIAMAMMVGVLLPLAYSITSEKKLARTAFHRAVAMEIVDGEMEILAAGEWRTFAPGQHEYPIRAIAATNLPPGRFLLTVSTNKVRLEWQPNAKKYGGAVVFREAKTK